MHGYIVILSLAFMISFVLLRSRQMAKLGIKAFHFGEMDKKDFLIPPFVLLYVYLILANTFLWPRIGGLQNWPQLGRVVLVPQLGGTIVEYSYVSAWIGAALCALAPAMFLWGLVSFGKSFRVGIDMDKPGGLVTSGAFAVSRNPLYVAFFMFLTGVFVAFPEWIFFVYLIAGLWLIDRQVCLEENALRKIYGKEYDEYCGKVRRYL